MLAVTSITPLKSSMPQFPHLSIREVKLEVEWTLEQRRVRGDDPPHKCNSVYNSQAALQTRGSSVSESTNRGSCSTVAFTTEKEICMLSGPAQFQPVLFKGHLHFCKN